MEMYLGSILLLPYSFAPRGMALCAGQLLPIHQNQALFSLIGTNFGGDGQTNFALPNLQDHAPIPGLSYFITLEGIFPSRD